MSRRLLQNMRDDMPLATSRTSAGSAAQTRAYWSTERARPFRPDAASLMCELFHGVREKALAKKSRHAVYRRKIIKKHDVGEDLIQVRTKPKFHRRSFREQERRETALRGPATRDADLGL